MTSIDIGTIVGLFACIALVGVLGATIGFTQPNAGPRGTRRLTDDERLTVYRIRLAEHRARLIVSEAIERELAPQVLAARNAAWDDETAIRPTNRPCLTIVGHRRKARREPDAAAHGSDSRALVLAPRAVRGSGKTATNSNGRQQ